MEDVRVPMLWGPIETRKVHQICREISQASKSM